MAESTARQFTFRLPLKLVGALDRCVERFREAGLSVNRTDVVRMLITHALETAKCDPRALLSRGGRDPAF